MSKNASKNAATEVRNEERDEYPVQWRDLEFTVPPFTRWSVDVIEAFQDERVLIGVRGLLGPEQWAMFKGTTPQPVMRDVVELSDLIAAAVTGVDSMGESQASSDS